VLVRVACESVLLELLLTVRAIAPIRMRRGLGQTELQVLATSAFRSDWEGLCNNVVGALLAPFA
jgi:hypothetical protein